jgi:hypothetical protein
LPSRGGAGQSRRGLEAVEEAVSVLLVVQEPPHLAQRVEVLWVASLGERSELRLNGSRIRGVEGESSRGAEAQESIGRLERGDLTQLRTDSQEGVKLRSG